MAGRLLTAQEAADVLKLSDSKLYLMVRRGELTAIYLNRDGRRAMRFRRSDLDAIATPKNGQQSIPDDVPKWRAGGKKMGSNMGSNAGSTKPIGCI